MKAVAATTVPAVPGKRNFDPAAMRERMRTRAEQLDREEKQRQAGDIPFWSPKDRSVRPKGNKIRVMPPWSSEAEFWFKESWEHFIAGKKYSDLLGPQAAEYVGRLSVTCLKAVLGEKCPCCERRHDLFETGRRNKADKDIAIALRPKRRVYCNLVDLTDQESTDKGVQVWVFGEELFKRLANLDASDLEDGGTEGLLSHPEQGRNLVLMREGTGLSTEYPSLLVGAKPSKLLKPEWLDQLHDLSLLTQPLSYDETQAALLASPAGIGPAEEVERAEAGGEGPGQGDDNVPF